MKNYWTYDQNTYTPISFKNINKNIEIFNKSYKKIISNEDKLWSTLINDHPAIPTIYRLPKT